MDFSSRSTVNELMDDPNMDAIAYDLAYKDINRCNQWLGGYALTLYAVEKLIQTHKKKSYTIFDMGCGDGSMLRKLSVFLERRQIAHKLIGIDLRDDVLDIARARSADFDDIEYRKGDILKFGSHHDCDIIINTLTMHHFDDENIPLVLDKFCSLAAVGVVINDLHRSYWAYHLFKLFSVFFINTHTAKYDGLVSISKGFIKKELVAFSRQIGNVTHNIQWKWAFRYLWIMKKKE
ncbi:MAG: methyltransferase domain-containing protein [Bacteroidota bacterium]